MSPHAVFDCQIVTKHQGKAHATHAYPLSSGSTNEAMIAGASLALQQQCITRLSWSRVCPCTIPNILDSISGSCRIISHATGVLPYSVPD